VTDLTWLDAISGDLPVFVIAEGLVMYLPEKDGTALFRRITEQFPNGQIAFDDYSGSMVRLVSRLAESVEFLMMPELLARLPTTRARGAMYKVMGRFPFYRHLIRHLRYTFSVKPVV
jgi:O-methyltransferase involved in polyketide biosynthesis